MNTPAPNVILPGHSFQHGPVVPLPTRSGDLFAHVWAKGVMLGCLRLAHTQQFRGHVPMPRGARAQARAEGFRNVRHQQRSQTALND